ncbi:MAG: UvrD-helicase domain-containing protein [Candidatus Kapabacteria bacterium]|nr:UvrD-helicase domain-containing protein [Ignavibacteriota bacterium]MCW5886209.1 UvrD-helicase domain-containing protein [Candidatus Kapabacteria bacterium]
MFENINSHQNDILKDLNPAQKEAVEALNGPVLIIAGAGSGKTKALTHRIANLIFSGVKPNNILALTFTNKAASEMKERISNLVSWEKARYIWAGTFHSVFARILRSEATQIGYTPDFSIYDTDDSNSLIKKSIAKLNLQNQKLLASNIRSRISNLKNKLTTYTEFAGKASTSDEKVIAAIYREYEKQLKDSNAMDFDDLLINMIVLLRKSKEILQKYQNLFKYILIDEYQDTNRAQYIVVSLLGAAHQNICVVGDDAQSIYRWRGADITNILDFKNAYPYAKVIKLEQNYRSTKTILKAADCIIKRNKNQLQKQLWTENPVGELINIKQCADDREEAFRISSIIQSETIAKRKLNDVAVLYRTNAQSLAIENSLRAKNIPYIIVGGISFYKRKEIKDVLAYITLLINPSDNEAFMRAVNEPPRGIGQTSLRHLSLYAELNQISLLEACRYATSVAEIKGKAGTSAVEFYNMVGKYSEELQSEKSDSVIRNFLDDCGIMTMYSEIGSEESFDKLNNINQLLVDFSTFLKDNPEAGISEYLQQISLVSDIDEKDLKGNSVTLMTIHAAKGLEFKTVIISGLEKGLFPLERDKLSVEEEEEERRLFYVAVTRAMEKLFITYAVRRARFGDTSVQYPSKFLNEIPRELTTMQQSTGLNIQNFTSSQPKTPQKPAKPSYNEYSQIPHEESYSQMPVSDTELRPGDRVHHANFGKGQIINIDGFGQQRKAQVKFDSIGIKSLMLQFAKLDKL